MQLFTLYNFASNAAVIRGGRQGRPGPKSLETHSFHPTGPFPQFVEHRRYSLSTLEITQNYVTFRALQLC